MHYRLLVLFCLLWSVSAWAQADSKRVYVFPIKEEIAQPAWRITQEALLEADTLEADMILIEMDTYGGRVDMADSIRTAILRSEIPIYVLIDNNAASAGALISLACDSIYMKPGSTIGAATVVDQSGQPVPDKYQSYMRSKMRATAEENGRDPDIAEAMVDPDKYVPGVSDSGKVLTFTTKDAIANNFCEAELSNVREVLERQGIEEYELIYYTPSTLDKIIGWLINPAISGVLILVIFGGIYFELQTPGVGFPILAAAVAALLFFAPYYLEGLADNWEILIFIAGFVLLAVEVFAIPGFGVAGISGIALIMTGLVLSMIGNIGFDFEPVDGTRLLVSVSTVVTSLTISLVGVLFVGARMFQNGPLSKLVLKTSQQTKDGYVSNPDVRQNLIGLRGVATTDLRPGGKVQIGSDHWDAFSVEGFVENGANVEVVGVESAQIKVRSIPG